MLFNYEWWFENGYSERVAEAKRRCANARYPATSGKPDSARAQADFLAELEARTIIYLRDGFSYELKELVPLKSTSCLTFECAPTDDAYKVGCFIAAVPFEEISRVEVFAVHPKEKPEDMPSIKGFAGAQAPGVPPKRLDDRARREIHEPATHTLPEDDE